MRWSKRPKSRIHTIRVWSKSKRTGDVCRRLNRQSFRHTANPIEDIFLHSPIGSRKNRELSVLLGGRAELRPERPIRLTKRNRQSSVVGYARPEPGADRVSVLLPQLIKRAAAWSLIAQYTDVCVKRVTVLRDLPLETLKSGLLSRLWKHSCLKVHRDSLRSPALWGRSCAKGELDMQYRSLRIPHDQAEVRIAMLSGQEIDQMISSTFSKAILWGFVLAVAHRQSLGDVTFQQTNKRVKPHLKVVAHGWTLLTRR